MIGYSRMSYQDLLLGSIVYPGCLNFYDTKLVLVICIDDFLSSEPGSAPQGSHCLLYFSQQRTMKGVSPSLAEGNHIKCRADEIVFFFHVRETVMFAFAIAVLSSLLREDMRHMMRGDLSDCIL